MKALYLFLAVATLMMIIIQSVITFAKPAEEATVSQLEKATDAWSIDVIEDNFYFKKGDEKKLKKDILGFFKQAGSPAYLKLVSIFYFLVIVFVFSVMGYFRECWIQRVKTKAEQGSADKPASASQSKKPDN
jgi:ABC-type transport system involved in multi-copper enzyme maturation permease subunit